MNKRMTDLLLLITMAHPCAKREMLLVRRTRLERERESSASLAAARHTFLLATP